MFEPRKPAALLPTTSVIVELECDWLLFVLVQAPFTRACCVCMRKRAAMRFALRNCKQPVYSSTFMSILLSVLG